MSTRQFVFCDLCNNMGIRLVEERRNRFRAGGRRRVDGRAWIEGGREEAKSFGWVVDEDGNDVCSACHEKGLDNQHFQFVNHQTVRQRLGPYS